MSNNLVRVTVRNEEDIPTTNLFCPRMGIESYYNNRE